MRRRRSTTKTGLIARPTITLIMGVVGRVKVIPRRAWPYIFSAGLAAALVYPVASALPAVSRLELTWVGVVAVMALGAWLLMRFGQRKSAVSIRRSVAHEARAPDAVAPPAALGLAGLTIQAVSRIVPRAAAAGLAKSASHQLIASPTASTRSERAGVAVKTPNHSEQLLRELESLRSRSLESNEPVAKPVVSVRSPEPVSLKSMRPQSMAVPALPPIAPASMSSILASDELQIALRELRASRSARLPRAKPTIVVGKPVLAGPATDLAAASTRHLEARETPTTRVVLPAAGINAVAGQEAPAAARDVADIAMEVMTESRAAKGEEKAGNVNRGNFHERGFATPPPFVKDNEPGEAAEPTAWVVPQPPVPHGEKFVDHPVVSIAKQVLREARAERFAALAGALRRLAGARDRALPSSRPAAPRPVTSPSTKLTAPIEPASIESTRHLEARETPTTRVVLPAAEINAVTGQEAPAAARDVADIAMEVLTESRAARGEEKAGSVNRGNFHERGFATPAPFVKDNEPGEAADPTAWVVPQPPVPHGEKFVDHPVVSIAKQVLREARAERFAALSGALRRLADARDRALPSSRPASPRPDTSPSTELTAPIEPASIESSASTVTQGFRVPQAPRPQRVRDIVVDLGAALAELETRAPTAQPKPAGPRARPEPRVAVAPISAGKQSSFMLDMSKVAIIRDQGLAAIGTGIDHDGEPPVKFEAPIKGEAAKALTPEIQAPGFQVLSRSKLKSVAANPPLSQFAIDLAQVARLQDESREVELLLGAIFVDEAQPNAARPASASKAPVEEGECISGLDAAHSRFATLILSRETWSREALERHATEYDLMLDGALELINDRAYDVFGEALTEEGESIEVNVTVATRMKVDASVNAVQEKHEAQHA